MDECSIYGLLVYYGRESENGETKRTSNGYLAGVTFRRTDLKSAKKKAPFPRPDRPLGDEFRDAEKTADDYVRENLWWDPTFDPTWSLVREPMDLGDKGRQPIEGRSMGVLFAIAKAKLAVGWGQRHLSNAVPIHRCDLSGVAVTGTLDVASGPAKNPAIGRVEELAPKLGMLLQHAASLAIHVLIVPWEQDGLNGEGLAEHVIGSVHDPGFHYRSLNTHTQSEHRLLVIRARDVNDAIVRLSEAQGRNVYEI